MTDKLTPDRRSANMGRIRSKDTAPEMVVRKLVHSMGYRYRLHVRTLPGKPDLTFTRLRKIIEVRGCFWHQHGKCADSHIPKSRLDYWQSKLAGNVARDEKNTRTLQKLGWRILVVWECDVKKRSLSTKLVRFLSQP